MLSIGTVPSSAPVTSVLTRSNAARLASAIGSAGSVGIFNGSGLDEDLRQYWTRAFNYSAKAQVGLIRGMNFVASYQTTRPQFTRIHLYDVGCTYRTGRWLMEAEYLRKEYVGGVFSGVDAVDAFLCYDLPIKKVLRKISFLVRCVPSRIAALLRVIRKSG